MLKQERIIPTKNLIHSIETQNKEKKNRSYDQEENIFQIPDPQHGHNLRKKIGLMIKRKIFSKFQWNIYKSKMADHFIVEGNDRRRMENTMKPFGEKQKVKRRN